MSTQPPKRSVSVWKGDATFEHQPQGGVTYYTDAAPEGFEPHPLRGPAPMESLLGALSGCAGVDFVSIVKKMRLDLRSLRTEITAERSAEHPRVYTAIHLEYTVETDEIEPRKVRRALGLALGKYCSVASMLRSAARITYRLHYGGEVYEGVAGEGRGASHD